MLFGDLSDLPYRLLALLAAVTVHEFAHAYIADRLGDPTPRSQGRLTLNPLAHLDLVGSLMILLTRFGWAKPVQINPANFSNWRRDTILVSAAGPLANVTLLFVLGIPYKLGLDTSGGPLERVLLTTIIINAGLAVFNLLPIPPLDGSKILIGVLPAQQAIAYARLQPYGVLILLAILLTGFLTPLIVAPMRWLIAQATGIPLF